MYKIIYFLLSFSIFAESLTLNLITDVPKDAKKFYKTPLNSDKNDYLIGAGFFAASYLLMNFDEDIKEFKDNNENETLDNLFPLFRKFGEFYPPLILFSIGQLTDNEKATKTGFYSAEASVLGLGITFIGKNIFARARPYSGEGADSWNNERFNKTYTSFPSGHSTVAFATATVISEMYKDKKHIPPLMYTLAALAAFSRVYDDKHWTSDIFLGSAIGYFSGKLLLDIKKQDGTFLYPQTNGTEFGLTFGGKF